MPCPQHKGKHPFHDSRWIATHDAEPEFGHDPRSWYLASGSLICQMQDGPEANARLIAAAPDLLAALVAIVGEIDDLGDVDESNEDRALLDAARAAIAKVTKGTS